MTKPHLYFHTPTILFQALVNMPGTITYPVDAITYDNVSLGSYTDVEFDATLLLGTEEGGDDLGRVRVKTTPTADTITIARASKGVDDGLITIQDNAYITILDDYRPWAKLPYFELTDESFIGNDYKDGDVEAGTYNTNIPPVANAGPWVAGYVDPITNELAVAFPDGVANLSFAMADGATISSYSWDVADGVITVGTGASAMITATFPPGFRWVKLSVTDSNAVTHSARCAVLAIDPDDDPTFKHFSMSQRLEKRGQTLEIEIYEDLPRSAYPDGTLVMMWWDNPEDENDKSHMKFTGWIANERLGISRKKTGFSRTTSITAVDMAGYLALLPGFPQALERTESDSPWSYMPSLDMNKALYYIIFWHSTAINLVDFFLPSDGDDYDAMRIDANGGSLFDQVNSLAMKMVPDHYLTCNTKGQLSILRDWRLDDVGDRPTSAPIITEEYWNELNVDYTRTPKVHSLRSGAILSSTAFTVVDGVDTIPLVFSVAPGDAAAFGQGVGEAVENEGLTISQDELNVCEGHRYAMLNSRYGAFRFKDPTGSYFWNYEPAAMNRVQLNIGADKAAQRGLDFTTASGMVQSISVDYKRDKTGLQISVDVVWEKETEGYPALTHVPEDAEDVGYTPPPSEPFVPSDPTNPDELYGDIAAYVLWDGTDIVRTWDLQDASPTWERIDTGISGNILDCQYMMVDADTVGAWLLTDTAVFYCADIMATTPSWSSKLTLATVQATAVAPTSGNVIFGAMVHYWSQPGHLCVAMSLDTENDDYLHCYYWVTEDYGATWTPVDVTTYTFGTGSTERCYYNIGVHGLACFRTSPGTIWAGRTNGRTGTSTGDAAVFKSIDLGLTWTKEHTFADWNAASGSPAILHPYPDATSRSYLSRQRGNNEYELWVSTDGWATATELTPPTGYEGGSGFSNHLMRPNKDPFRDDHLMIILKETGSSNGDIHESTDGGTTWTKLEDRNNSTNTPNGWPPDPDQWVIVDNTDSPYVQLTLDNFTSLLDKTGNLLSVLSGGSWAITGIANGFALPKVGPNDPGYPFPGWGNMSDSYVYNGETLTGSASAGSQDEGSVGVWACLHPPDDIVRVRVEGTYSCSYMRNGAFTTGFAKVEIDAPANVTLTSDMAGFTAEAPEDGSTFGSFWAEFELTSGSWPYSKEDVQSSPPSVQVSPYIKAFCFSTSALVETSSSITCHVTEMETSSGTIYYY